MPDTKIKCPSCEQESLWDSRNQFRPFCSERCKLIDLGAWANEEYTIPESKSASNFSSSETEDQLDRDHPSISPMH